MQSLLTLVRTSSFGLVFMFGVLTSHAQKIEVQTDLCLVDSMSKQQIPHSEKRTYIFKNQPKTFKNVNPVSLLYGGSLYMYQNFVSQHFSANCLFYPSCSDFSKQAVKEYGLLKGGLLTLDRLSRCNRIAATDLNPGTLNLKSHSFSDPVKSYK